MTKEESIAEKIQQRRLQILVHSCLYYNMNTNVVDDVTYDRWARELDSLQKQYPDIASKIIWADAFRDYSPSTGFDLPIDDPWVVQKATWLKSKLLHSSVGSSTTRISKPSGVTSTGTKKFFELK